MWPSDGIAAPVPNSSRLKGRSAAAWRVTLVDCARNQGNNTGAGPVTTLGRLRGGRLTRIVVSGSVSGSVAIVIHLLVPTQDRWLTSFHSSSFTQQHSLGDRNTGSTRILRPQLVHAVLHGCPLPARPPHAH